VRFYLNNIHFAAFSFLSILLPPPKTLKCLLHVCAKMPGNFFFF
jgi:hypothetical protein